MTTTRAVLFVTLMVAIAQIAHAGSKAKDGGVREARAAIEEANTQFSKAFEQGDSKTLAEMYTSDAIAFPPDSQMIEGNKAIGEFWKTIRNSGVTSATLTTLDVGRDGDIAYEVGKVSLTIQAEGKQPTKAVAKYVVVWKRQADGSWKLHRDIWNSAPPEK
jgi:uncharacterized protein (TIGR02246 family)